MNHKTFHHMVTAPPNPKTTPGVNLSTWREQWTFYWRELIDKKVVCIEVQSSFSNDSFECHILFSVKSSSVWWSLLLSLTSLPSAGARRERKTSGTIRSSETQQLDTSAKVQKIRGLNTQHRGGTPTCDQQQHAGLQYVYSMYCNRQTQRVYQERNK